VAPMTLAPLHADAEGAVIAWAAAHPTLTGRGNPLAAGLHVTEVRSPAEGAVGYIAVIDRSADDVADAPRVSVEILAKHRGVAELAARAYADALDKVATTRPTVTTARGEAVKILAVGDVAGPTYAGDFGGEHAYRVDATFILQPA
jgi:hypothetical protein